MGIGGLQPVDQGAVNSSRILVAMTGKKIQEGQAGAGAI